jgi:hypothetical protein
MAIDDDEVEQVGRDVENYPMVKMAGTDLEMRRVTMERRTVKE